MKANEIIEKLRAALPDAVVELTDLTGTENHWQASIVSAVFAGKSLLQRHRLVYAVLAADLETRIDALSLDTRTPDEARGA